MTIAAGQPDVLLNRGPAFSAPDGAGTPGHGDRHDSMSPDGMPLGAGWAIVADPSPSLNGDWPHCRSAQAPPGCP